METITKTKTMPNSALSMPIGTEVLRLDTSSELTDLFEKQPTTESQLAWMLAAVFFTIELP